MNSLVGKGPSHTCTSGLIALLIAAGFMLGVQSPAVAGTPLVRPHQLAPPAVPKGLKPLGTIPGSQKISLSVVLPPSNQDQLHTLLKNLYDPKSPQYHQWLKKGQFDSEFGPSAATVGDVESWLHSRGLEKTELSGSAVQVSASASTVSSALGTSFEHYRASSGTEGYVAQGAPLVPETLANGQIQSILGLDTVSRYEPQSRTSKSSAHTRIRTGIQPRADGLTPCAGAVNTEGGGYWGLDQLGAAYGLNSLLSQGQNGHGETIGLYELASHSPSDVNRYMNCFGLHNAVSTVQVDGGGGPAVGFGTSEADLDIEQAATQSPGASIISYEGPNNTVNNAYDVWNSIVTSDAAQVVSTSWGECEMYAMQDGSIGSFNPLFQRAAVQGQSIFAATGDSGSEDCFSEDGFTTSLQTDYPSSDPYVTAAGGTELLSPGTELVWNNCQGQTTPDCANFYGDFGAAGGGLSDSEPRPNYQPSVVPVNASCNNACRETPDVSANAGVGMVIYDNGGWDVGFGTSFASPFWAGLQADRNTGCTSSSAGVASTALYYLYQQGVAYGGNAFNDIINGDNDLTGSNAGAWPSSGGYDLASGIGTPIAAGLSCPEITGVTENGSVGEATISGLGLRNASITFGGLPATVLSSSSTGATVVLPTGSGTVTVQAAGVLGTGVTTSLFSYPPAITTTSLAPGILNSPYAQTLSATSGTPPYAWSIINGTLPAGLHLIPSTGAITGTPTVAGTQSITFAVTDAESLEATVTLSIGIYDAGSTTVASVSPAQTIFGGTVAYSATVTSGSGTPTGTVTFSAGSTTLCTTTALSSGAGACSAINAPTGADTVTATYTSNPTFAFAPSSGTAPLTVTSGPYSPLTPVRICDTRAGNPSALNGKAAQCNGSNPSGNIGAGGTQTFNVAGSFGVPADANAVVLNVTVVNPAAGGYLTAFPAGAKQPFASNLNYSPGEVVPNLVQVGIGKSGNVSIYSLAQADIVVDLEGYVGPTASGGPGAGLYTPLSSPARLCDTRASNPSNLSSPTPSATAPPTRARRSRPRAPSRSWPGPLRRR